MHIYSSEAWQLLLGQLLPKLVACQRLLAHPLLPFTCMRLLALPPRCVVAADRQAVFEELAGCFGPGHDALGASTVQLQALTAVQVGRRAGAGVRSRRRQASECTALAALGATSWPSLPAPTFHACACRAVAGPARGQRLQHLLRFRGPSGLPCAGASGGAALRWADRGGGQGLLICASSDHWLLTESFQMLLGALPCCNRSAATDVPTIPTHP